MEIKKSVSIVIPNYNGRHLLQEFLPYTLAVIEDAQTPYEIIIVDDASTDDSVNFIKTAYPNLKLIINTENKGFSYTCNQGIAAAEKELILLLNSDVKLTPGYFDSQWKYFMRWDTFGVMGRITDMDGDRIQDAARMPKLKGYKLKTDYFFYTENKDDRLCTLYLSGANALIDAAKLKQIGGFYELFSPFYCEDMELSLRAWRLNWKCYYDHYAICRHQVSASTKNYDTAGRIKTIYFRNRFYLHALHLSGKPLFLWYLQITFIDLLPKLLGGQTWIWESYRELFKNKKLIRAYRERLNELLFKNESNVKVLNVVKRIRASIGMKRLIKFNP